MNAASAASLVRIAAMVLLLDHPKTCASERIVDMQFDLSKTDTLGKDFIRATTSTDTILECSVLCLDDPWCVGFYYTLSGSCQTAYRDSPTSQSSSGTVYFAMDNPNCPEDNGYIAVPDESTCYKLHPQGTWADGNDTCYAENAHLAKITTQQKDNYLNTFLDETTKPFMWVGARVINGQYEWWDGELLVDTYSNWSPNFPQAPDLCVSILAANEWKNRDCDSIFLIWCEIDIE